MLDMRFVRENADLVKENLKRRGEIDKVPWVDQLINDDKKWRSVQSEANNLRAKRNKLTEEIAQLRRKGQDTSSLVKQAEQIPDQIKELEQQTAELEKKVTSALMSLPNIMHESVPFGKDENDNLEVRKWGEASRVRLPTKRPHRPSDRFRAYRHGTCCEGCRRRFYYLRGDLVKLNHALIMFALDFIEKKGYTLTLPPYLLRREAVGGAVALSDFEDVIYKIEGEDLYLLATSEHALLAQHMDEILDGKSLPLRYAGVSPKLQKGGWCAWARYEGYLPDAPVREG